jgi:hypothetical protein
LPIDLAPIVCLVQEYAAMNPPEKQKALFMNGVKPLLQARNAKAANRKKRHARAHPNGRELKKS